jgi:predicted O-methyltransferase YrrM
MSIMTIKEYLKDINKTETNEFFIGLVRYAEAFDVPIIEYDSLQLIEQFLIATKAKTVLEIGSAIGYSALHISYYTGVHVTTIERNNEMISEAKNNINAIKDVSVTLIEGDALEVSLDKLGEYDCLFIDAAKAQNIAFFERFVPLVKTGGLVIVDNLLFHEEVINEDIASKSLKSMVKKVKDFNKYIVSKDKFTTFIYNVGDGLSISIKE